MFSARLVHYGSVKFLVLHTVGSSIRYSVECVLESGVITRDMPHECSRTHKASFDRNRASEHQFVLA